MEQQTHSFAKGMSKDVAKTLQPESSYYNANNIRLISELGQSGPIVVNIKGNEFSFDLPDIAKVWECKYIVQGTQTEDQLYSGYAGISINGTFIQVDRNGTSLPIFLKNLVAAINTDSAMISDGVRACINKEKNGIIVQSQKTANLTCLPNSDFYADIFVNSDSGLQLVGWTTIRNDIYLLAGSGTNGISAVFKLEFNYSQLAPVANSPKLIYSGVLNINVDNIIFPNAIVGIYENEKVQKIYWTDNNNPMYMLNVASDSVFNNKPESVQIFPGIKLNTPILSRINETGGSLDVGMYNIFYRLSNKYGQQTSFSPLSNNIRIDSKSDSLDYKDHIGDKETAVSSKNIDVAINEIDRSFDYVEIGYTFVKDTTGINYFYLMERSPITRDNMVFTVDNLSTNTILLPEEFLALNNLFDTAKTMCVKNEVLLVGNTKTKEFNIDFDARAYRFKAPGVTYCPVNLTNWSLDETHDAINPFNTDFNDDPTKRYIYQSDGVTLGGEGKNVKYTFFAQELNSDEATYDTTKPQTNGVNNNTYNLGISGYNHTNHSYASVKSPYLQGVFRGYKRGEVYRFGIVFYSKTGKTSFVKWIGDIKFPDILDRGNISWPTHVFKGGNVFATRQLGIKFEIDLSSVKDDIYGAEIVRVKRNVGDRTRHSQGMIMPLMRSHFNDQLYLPDPTTLCRTNVNVETGTTMSDVGGTALVSEPYQPTNYISMISPEHNFGQSIKTDDIDYIKQISTLTINATSNPPETPNDDPDCLAYFFKAYQHNNITSSQGTKKKYKVKSSIYLSRESTGTLAGKTLYNHVGFNPASTNNTYISTGIDGTFIELYDAIPYIALDNPSIGNQKIALCDYVKELTRQYGGATYLDRSRNEYITTGAFIPNSEIQRNNGVYKTNITVFGGDIFVVLYDVQKFYPFNSGTPVEKISATYCFPVETVVNTEIRSGGTMGNTFKLDVSGLSGIGAGEDFYYNWTFSHEPTVRVFIPQPFDFIPVNENDNRVWGSEVKILGETIDSWTIFKDLEYIDVNPVYGPLNALEMVQNKVLFLQSKAFGQISSNERTVVQDTTGVELQLGTGRKLERYDYISTEVGSFHQGSVTKSMYALYFFDIWKKKLFIYDGNLNSLSDAKGLYTFFLNRLNGSILKNDNPLVTGGISCTYDYKYDEVIYTFIDKDPQLLFQTIDKFTVAYSDKLKCFTSFYDINSPIYINNRTIILTPAANNNDIYLMDKGNNGEFFGTAYPSDITIITNKAPMNTKVFDNIAYHQEAIDESTSLQVDTTFDSTEQYTDYQNTGTTSLISGTNVKRKERTWNIQVGRDSNGTDRLRDKYMTTTLTWDNSSKPLVRFLLHYINIFFRVSSR